MSTDHETAKHVANTNFRATVISGLLGCFGVIVAAWIGVTVGKQAERKQNERQDVGKDVQIAQQDAEITRLKAQISALQKQLNNPGRGGEVVGSELWRDPQSANGFTFKLQQCARRGETVTCDFTVVADQKDDRLYVWAKSRLFDSTGSDHLASSIFIGGNGEKVSHYGAITHDLVRGIPVRARVTFEGVPTTQVGVPLLELALSGDNVQFRDVPLS
jgi:hypothetical protein